MLHIVFDVETLNYCETGPKGGKKIYLTPCHLEVIAFSAVALTRKGQDAPWIERGDVTICEAEPRETVRKAVSWVYTLLDKYPTNRGAVEFSFVGWNCERFDIPVMHHVCEKYGLVWPTYDMCIDLCHSHLFPHYRGMGPSKLEDAGKHIGFEWRDGGADSALVGEAWKRGERQRISILCEDDRTCTAELFKRVTRYKRCKQINDIGNCWEGVNL
jgi:hypothetical protein